MFEMYDIIDMTRTNHVIILSFLPHSTHKLQLLQVSAESILQPKNKTVADIPINMLHHMILWSCSKRFTSETKMEKLQ